MAQPVNSLLGVDVTRLYPNLFALIRTRLVAKTHLFFVVGVTTRRWSLSFACWSGMFACRDLSPVGSGEIALAAGKKYALLPQKTIRSENADIRACRKVHVFLSKWL